MYVIFPPWNGPILTLVTRVLLDDCLAAVDSHVARHVFGTYCLQSRMFPRLANNVGVFLAQTMSSDRMDYLPPKLGF